MLAHTHLATFAHALTAHPRWDVFLEEHWLRRPFLFEGVLPEPFLSEPALLEMYRTAGQRAAGDENVVFYARPTAEPEWEAIRADEAARFLPSSEDRTLAAYVESLLGPQGLAAFSAHLRYNMLHFCPEAWWRARGLLSPLFAAKGFPAGGWDLDCYAGQYKETVFGVHTDQEDQLYLTPVGTKVMRLWHPDAWRSAERPDTYRFRHAEHPAAPLVYTVGPRDVLYWPQEYFHIGEAPSFALSVQINMRRLPAHALTEQEGMTPERRSAIARYDLALRSAWFTTTGDPPEPFHVPVPTATAAASTGAEAQGAESGVLPAGGRFRIGEIFPLVHGVHEGELVLACNGCVWSLPDSTVARRLVERLSPGAVWTIAALRAEIDAGLPEEEQIDEEDLVALLGELAKVGVLTPSEPGEPGEASEPGEPAPLDAPAPAAPAPAAAP